MGYRNGGVKMKFKPQQLEVPGWNDFYLACKRDKARLKGERSGRPLPLFDHLDNTPETDSADQADQSGGFHGIARGG